MSVLEEAVTIRSPGSAPVATPFDDPESARAWLDSDPEYPLSQFAGDLDLYALEGRLTVRMLGFGHSDERRALMRAVNTLSRLRSEGFTLGEIAGDRVPLLPLEGWPADDATVEVRIRDDAPADVIFPRFEHR